MNALPRQLKTFFFFFFLRVILRTLPAATGKQFLNMENGHVISTGRLACRPNLWGNEEKTSLSTKSPRAGPSLCCVHLWLT